MELLPAIETLQWLAEHGPEDPQRRAHRLLARAAPGQARALELRAARRRRRARAGGRAVRHAAGRRRRRADGRQRRRPQALAARRAWRASGSRASSPAPGCPRACCASSTATPTPARALVERARRAGALHRLGRRRARRRRGCARGVKRARAGDRRQGRRARAAPTPTSSARRAASSGRAFANAGQCGGSIERAIVVREVHDGSSRPSAPARARCASATRRTRRPRSARSCPARARTACASSSTRPSRAARRVHCGGTRRRARTSRRSVLTGVRDDMRIAREDVPGPGARRVARPPARTTRSPRPTDRRSGLGASVWTADRYKAQRIAAELRVGMVWMNDHLVTRARRRCRGAACAASGIGPRARRDRAAHLRRAEGRHLGPAASAAPCWWFPYDAGAGHARRARSRGCARRATPTARPACARARCRRCASPRARSGAVLDQPELAAGAVVGAARRRSRPCGRTSAPALREPSRSSAATRSATASPPSRSSTQHAHPSRSWITL